MSETSPLSDRPVLVVDFGAQYAQLIARRVREANVFSEVVPSTMPAAEMLAKEPAAIILSGGPSSVYEEGAPSLDPGLLDAGVPVFGMCYGFQAMVQALGGTVDHTGLGEYGSTPAQVSDTDSTLFNGQPTRPVGLDEPRRRGDRCPRRHAGHGVDLRAPPSRRSRTTSRRLYGVQWHPEVMHSTFGQRVLENFLLRGAGLVGRVDGAQRRRVARRAGARDRRRQAGAVRPLRRRRLVGGGRARPARRR